jgi:hypothetical protein
MKNKLQQNSSRIMCLIIVIVASSLFFLMHDGPGTKYKALIDLAQYTSGNSDRKFSSASSFNLLLADPLIFDLGGSCFKPIEPNQFVHSSSWSWSMRILICSLRIMEAAGSVQPGWIRAREKYHPVKLMYCVLG